MDNSIIELQDGDVNKLAVIPIGKGGCMIKVYDGTHADRDDLLIQAKLNHNEVVELLNLLGQVHNAHMLEE
jgi:hypothetical protein